MLPERALGRYGHPIQRHPVRRRRERHDHRASACCVPVPLQYEQGSPSLDSAPFPPTSPPSSGAPETEVQAKERRRANLRNSTETHAVPSDWWADLQLLCLQPLRSCRSTRRCRYEPHGLEMLHNAGGGMRIVTPRQVLHPRRNAKLNDAFAHVAFIEGAEHQTGEVSGRLGSGANSRCVAPI